MSMFCENPAKTNPLSRRPRNPDVTSFFLTSIDVFGHEVILNFQQTEIGSGHISLVTYAKI